jgi:diguanylate cyclase (GGDEF)-like protein
MFLDLDRFKEINDSLGHAVGNDLLKSVVKRLQGSLREQDTLARFGGDEFTFLFVDGGAKDERTAALAERLLDRFSDPFNVGGRQLTVKASIGVAVYPHDGEDAETLLKHADTAMYQAKSAGRNTYEIFDSAMSARARLRFALEDNLRAAVEYDRLAVHYQPKLDMETGTIAGVEALARWNHPQLGFIPPWAFIPLAEETSLVASLGEWVLEDACRQVRRWQEQGLPAVPVAVNLSPRQFMHHSVVDVVAKVLRRTGLDPTLLELEVTESVLMDHKGEAAASLGELRAMGVRCSIDDFGTGYNALSYLAEIPVDAIKIDRSFIHRIDGEQSGAPIVGAVIALAHGLGLTVVAEGVETDAQLRFLDAHDCDQVQGFRFSPPVSADEFALLVRRPERMFTVWSDELPKGEDPASGVSSARLEALLDSVLQDRRWPSELDTEAIETVLAALARDDSTRARRTPRARSARAGSRPGPGPAPVEADPCPPSLAPVERLADRLLHATNERRIDRDQGAPRRSTG